MFVNRRLLKVLVVGPIDINHGVWQAVPNINNPRTKKTFLNYNRLAFVAIYIKFISSSVLSVLKILYEQNWFQFHFVVKAIALKQQIGYQNFIHTL